MSDYVTFSEGYFSYHQLFVTLKTTYCGRNSLPQILLGKLTVLWSSGVNNLLVLQLMNLIWRYFIQLCVFSYIYSFFIEKGIQ